MNREAFEAEARKHGFILDRLDKSGEYVQLITEQAWLMWQAATDAALERAAEEIKQLNKRHWFSKQSDFAEFLVDAIRALKEQP